MNRFAVAGAAAVMAVSAIVTAPAAEARHGYGYGGGGGLLAAALVVGVAAAIIASRHHRHRGYYGARPVYYGGYYPRAGHFHHRRW